MYREAANPSPMRIPSTLADSGFRRDSSGAPELVCLHKAAEQQPLAVADPCLYAALDLVVVEQALGLDVVLGLPSRAPGTSCR